MSVKVVLQVPKQFQVTKADLGENWVDLRVIPLADRDDCIERYDYIIADADDRDTALIGLMGAKVVLPGSVDDDATIRVAPDHFAKLLRVIVFDRERLVSERVLHPFVVTGERKAS